MRNRGYSLIELLIGIAIASVLLSLAVPGFRGLIAREEAVAAINGIINAITNNRINTFFMAYSSLISRISAAFR